jgi:carboxypeptidase Taq
MTDQLLQLRNHLAELVDLRDAAHLLGWDQQTMMPPNGGSGRAEALATLERISHEKFISAETGRLIDDAAAALDGADPDGDDARLISVSRRHWEKARRVPTDLAGELVRAASIGQEAWVQARQSSDFGAFAPYLEHNLELARRYAACFDHFDCPYDALLDDYDPGLSTRTVGAVFDELKAELVPMIATVSGLQVDDSCLHGQFAVADQRRLAAAVVERMGFHRESWRMDDAVHPFATGFGPGDIRITNRWDATYFASGLFGAMHECGHGLYEEGIKPSLQRTPLGRGESLSIHESQSRLWENMVGRGRSFAEFLAPLLAEHLRLDVEAEVLHRAVNQVEPSFIRVEADEATYGLHIILRFELEQELIDGRLAVGDLPGAWNGRFAEYFGVDVPDDARGVLQDVHWSAGLIGYFPTYSLGNLIAGHLWQRAHVDLDDLEQQIAAGELSPLRDWLREHVHQHGSKFSSSEMLQRVAGTELAVGPFVDYLKAKLGRVYGVEL